MMASVCVDALTGYDVAEIRTFAQEIF